MTVSTSPDRSINFFEGFWQGGKKATDIFIIVLPAGFNGRPDNKGPKVKAATSNVYRRKVLPTTANLMEKKRHRIQWQNPLICNKCGGNMVLCKVTYRDKYGDADLARQADTFKQQFKALLREAVSLANGFISPDAASSGEIVADFTLNAENVQQRLEDQMPGTVLKEMDFVLLK